MAPHTPLVADAPLAATVARMNEASGARSIVVGEAEGDRWVALDDPVDELVDLLLAGGIAGAPDYVGATVASMLVDVPVAAALPALLIDRRLPDVRPEALAGHRHPDQQWFDQIAIRRPAVSVLPDDPVTAHPDATVVPDLDALHRSFASALVAAATPWFAAVRARAPFGTRGMWGQLADGICATAISTARHRGTDRGAAWDEAQRLLDVIADEADRLRVRPRPFPVSWSGGHELFQVRGTCCLWYKTQTDPDPCGAGYCSTCPLRDDTDRSRRLSAWLEETAAR